MSLARSTDDTQTAQVRSHPQLRWPRSLAPQKAARHTICYFSKFGEGRAMLTHTAIKGTILILLIALSPVRADDHRNVYDAFRELLKPSPEATIEEQVTAHIKRHMATLLYPVDMSTFAGPDKDARFRDVIRALQKQMGEPATGTMTSTQFDRLANAARDFDDRGIFMGSGKLVTRISEMMVLAVGTGAMEGIANPINITRILCQRGDGACEMSIAEFDLKNGMLSFGSPVDYEIKTWRPNRITALREHPCGTATMAIDVDNGAVTITSVPRADLPFCSKEPTNVWTLVDGFQVAWKIYQDRASRARALVYEPSKRFVPLR